MTIWMEVECEGTESDRCSYRIGGNLDARRLSDGWGPRGTPPAPPG